MPFNGTEGKPISLGTAKQWTKNWQGKNPPSEQTPKAIFFGKDNIQALLNEEGSMGIRIYYAQDDNGNNHLVLVAAKENEGNILPDGDELESGGGTIIDDGKKCPPDCPPTEEEL